MMFILSSYYIKSLKKNSKYFKNKTKVQVYLRKNCLIIFMVGSTKYLNSRLHSLNSLELLLIKWNCSLSLSLFSRFFNLDEYFQYDLVFIKKNIKLVFFKKIDIKPELVQTN